MEQNSLQVILLSCIFLPIGIILVVGTKQNWPYLVDPPKHAMFNLYRLKEILGPKLLKVFHYFVGIAFILLSLSALIALICGVKFK